jgi:hypothetical protein
LSAQGRLSRPIPVDLAYAHQHIDLAVPPGHPRGQRHADADESLWPSAPVQASTPGTTVSGGRPERIVVAETVKLLAEEVSIRRRVERQTAMAFAQMK